MNMMMRPQRDQYQAWNGEQSMNPGQQAMADNAMANSAMGGYGGGAHAGAKQAIDMELAPSRYKRVFMPDSLDASDPNQQVTPMQQRKDDQFRQKFGAPPADFTGGNQMGMNMEEEDPQLSALNMMRRGGGY